MKMVILIVGAAFTLVGCNEQQGGTSDQYGTERGISSTITNTFGTRSPSDTNSKGGATSQGGTGTSTSSSENKTNSSSNP